MNTKQAQRTRRFVDAKSSFRCEKTIVLRDGSKAQCGRARVVGLLCTQHAVMLHGAAAVAIAKAEA
jgi:hypothetical protein